MQLYSTLRDTFRHTIEEAELQRVLPLEVRVKRRRVPEIQYYATWYRGYTGRDSAKFREISLTTLQLLLYPPVPYIDWWRYRT
jgi:hypothetical protein